MESEDELYKPGFTIYESFYLSKNKKARPVDRSDRYFIDNWNLELFWCIDLLREDFILKCDRIRELLEIPNLVPVADRYKPKLSNKPPQFAPKSRYIGVNSSFLKEYPQTEKKLEKMIYNNILTPYQWSYNFYPFVEYFILYNHRTSISIKPNPLLLKLILDNKKELGRNLYTKSDIAFIKQQAVILRKNHPAERKSIKTAIVLIENLSSLKNKQRIPRNPELKHKAFREFNKIQKNELHDKNFLLRKLYEIVQADLTEEDEKKVHATIRKLYSEYKKFINSKLKISYN